MKFHVNPDTGNAGACKAEPGRCPFGQDALHYNSLEAARAGFEKENSQLPPTVKKPNKFMAQWDSNSHNVQFASKRTPGAKVDLFVGGLHYSGQQHRTLEAWLEIPGEEGAVAFVQMLHHDAEWNTLAGEHLVVCDIETKVSQRKKGFARELHESVAEHIGLSLYTTGSYTPEGFAALGAHLPVVPQQVSQWAQDEEPASVKFNSMGFVASWKHKVPLNDNGSIERTDAQYDAMWEVADSGIREKMEAKEILWAED